MATAKTKPAVEETTETETTESAAEFQRRTVDRKDNFYRQRYPLWWRDQE